MRLRKFAGPVVAALAVTLLDQWTKAWIVKHLGLYEARAVSVDYFHIVHVRNRGVAFSLLSNLDHNWVNPALIVATVFAVAAVLAYIHYLPGKGPAPCGLGLVLGGAIGNLIDRARLGYVVDFLDVHWRHHHWPAFNVADIAITAGIFLLILDMLFWSKEGERASRSR
ncbi:MAG: signal peptidase II [Deltaproteobacteria bacterium]|nr:signal peptidase II [Deltaproteobacteria bacterium]